MKKRAVLGVLASLALASGALVALALPASGGVEAPPPAYICHRTNSNKNPYVKISPDVSGIINGHEGHKGPIWDPTLKALGIKWGDIIPAWDSNPGLNWPGGAAIWANNCSTEAPPEQQFGSLSVEKDVSGLPFVGDPTDGTIPSSFVIDVTCDDGTTQQLTFPTTGGTQVIDNIEAGSHCNAIEEGVDTFPTDAVVTYDPTSASDTDLETGGVIVNANATTDVTVTNDFTAVKAVTVTATPVPDAVVVAPAFTG